MVLNAALLLSPCETVILQMLHVAVGLLSLSNVKLFPHCDILATGKSNVMCASEFCHKLCYDVKKIGLGSTFKIANL